MTSCDVISEKQVDFVMREMGQQKDIDQDKVVTFYLPEFMIYILEQKYKMQREEVLEHLAAHEESNKLRGIEKQI